MPYYIIVLPISLSSWMKSEDILWPTQNECLESERHHGGNQNQGIPSCRFMAPLWLWNADNLSTAYKEAKPLSRGLSEEDTRHYMAQTHPRHRSFNLGFSSFLLQHLDAITVSLGRSCCPHERSPPPEETALRRTISGQALPRKPEKELQRHTEGLHDIFFITPKCLEYLAQNRDKWREVVKRGAESLWNQKKRSNGAALET